jgi:4-amino-4-deoxy-L-arabinose transferase-like glycosyltransferase
LSLRAARVAGSLRSRSAAALVLLVAGAAALRLDGIRYGLPLPLLNPDEESIVPRAWEIASGGGLDPDWYDYPSFVFYVLAPFQAFADEPSYLAGRLVVAALGVASVVAAVWLGRVAHGPWAGWVAGAATAVATTHVAYSRMAVTDVPLTLGITVALALIITGRLEWAGAAAGLAASAKYPGVFLVAPLLVAGWGQWRRLAVSGLAAAVAFATTSPFVLLHAGAAWDDASRVQRLARAGWLGFEDEGPAPVAFLDRLWEALGPFLLVAAGGLVVALARRRRADLVLALFALVYFASLLTIDAYFDRYVLPLVPVLAVLAGRVRPLAPVALALLVVPLVWTLGDNADLRVRDARLDAREWIERELPAGSRIAVDPSTPSLLGYELVALELPGPGRPFDPRRDLDRLRAEGVDYVVVTGAVTDRVLAARAEYPREAAFYDSLERRARRVYRIEPGEARGGPWVGVYRLAS